jgi:ammonia channel protein AmtB
MDFGFAFLEAGNCSKNSLINVLVKNVIVFCIATIAFWLLGFNLMFGDGVANFPINVPYTCGQEEPTTKLYSYIGNTNLTFELPFPSLDISKDSQGTNPLGYPERGFSCLKTMFPNRSFAAIFFFQLVFAGAAATIISGAMAERLNFLAFCLFSFFFILIRVIFFWSFWGGILFAFNSTSTKRKIRESETQKVGLIKKLFLWARHGIRLSVVEEYEGTYDFFFDPERPKKRDKI